MLNDVEILDNQQEATPVRDRLCLEAKASLLIEANVASGRFPAFMSGKTTASVTGEPLCARLMKKVSGQIFCWSKPPVNCSCQTAFKMDIAGAMLSQDGMGRYHLLPQQMIALRQQSHLWERQLRQAAYERFGSAFNAGQEISACKTPEQVCRFWGQSASPWVPLTNLRELHSAAAYYTEFSFMNIQPIFAGDEIETVFPWRDKDGDIAMWVARAVADGAKIYLPITQYFRNGSAVPMQFCLPAFAGGKLPLFNLPGLASCADKPVTVTDSMELASAHENDNDGIWTTWMPGTSPKLSDWSILNNAASIQLLVVNHSGRNLPEAYIKMHELKACLAENVEIEKLHAAQISVDYDVMQQEPLKLMSLTDFDKTVCAAVDYLQHPPKFGCEIQKKSQEISDNLGLDLLHHKVEPYKYLLRPFIVESEVTLFHAAKGLGKSMLSYSIATLLVSERQLHKELCPGTHWCARKQPCRILYLDFENNAGIISNRIKKHWIRHLGRNLKEQEASLKNLIVKDKSQLDKLNYSLPENHAKIIQWLEEAEQNGHVDLLIIDTLSNFIKNSDTIKTASDFSELCDKIKACGTAVLVLFHSNSEGDIRGIKLKRDQLYCAIRLTRDGKGAADDLKISPMILDWESLREPDYCPTQKIKLSNHGWVACNINNTDSVENLKEFSDRNRAEAIKLYKDVCGFTNEECMELLQISNGDFYKKELAKK